MFAERFMQARPDWSQPDSIKRYCLSAHGQCPHPAPFEQHLNHMLACAAAIDWAATPAFAIFHAGSGCHYLVLAWWGNGNELFVRVAVQENGGWVEDPARYSFCVHDLEIIWGERQLFVAAQRAGGFDLTLWRQQWYQRPGRA